jgi:hypothetical protein
MFLDDELYSHVMNREIKNKEDFADMVMELYSICENYFKSRISAQTTYKEGTQLMDKTFKLWDLFIQKLKKEKYPFIDILEKDRISFRHNWLANPKIKEIYDKGK